MTATALVILLLLCWYGLRQKEARIARLQRLKANSDRLLFLHYDNSSRPVHLHDI